MRKRGIASWGAHLRRLLRHVFRREPERSEIAGWLVEVQYLIGKHSTAPRKTDSVAWVTALTQLVENDIRTKNHGRSYDGNMALAAQLGMILVAWYAHVHRAKSYDSNRPLAARRAATEQRTRFLAELQAIIVDDSVMGEVWGKQQKWNYPFGRGAKGGKFV